MRRIFIDITVDDHSESGQYFLACARIRNITPRSLARRLFAVMTEDQLVGSVLDDADTIKDRQKGEHRFTQGRP